jgi:hypothetical protein
MTAKRVSLIVAAVAALCVGQNVAQAGDGWCGWGYGSCSWYTREYVPYYAMHPPVYYSYPVPRAYGWSPFAYPAYVMTPEAKPVAKPAMFHNPYVDPPKPAVDKKSENKSAANFPKIMTNPFVEPVQTASASR